MIKFWISEQNATSETRIKFDVQSWESWYQTKALPWHLTLYFQTILYKAFKKWKKSAPNNQAGSDDRRRLMRNNRLIWRVEKDFRRCKLLSTMLVYPEREKGQKKKNFFFWRAMKGKYNNWVWWRHGPNFGQNSLDENWQIWAFEIGVTVLSGVL